MKTLTVIEYIFSLLAVIAFANNCYAQSNFSGTSSTTLRIEPSTGDLRMNGYASPGAVVYFKENYSIIGTQAVDNNSYFDKTLSALTPGIHTISIYAIDAGSVTTLTVGYSLNIISGTTTILSGIILPPTFTISNGTVKRPVALDGGGRALNNSAVQVFIQSNRENLSSSVTTSSTGQWSANLNPKLHLGTKLAYSIALDGSGGQSGISDVKNYTVLLSADLNIDDRVELVDFSMLMFNMGLSDPPNVAADINDDSIIDLVDFSVMMFHWTN